MALIESIADALSGVITTQLAREDEFGNGFEERHRRALERCIASDERRLAIAVGLVKQATVAVNDGNLESRQPSKEQLGDWLTGVWHDIRPLAIVAGAQGEAV